MTIGQTNNDTSYESYFSDENVDEVIHSKKMQETVGGLRNQIGISD
jgi:hypothetical protein